MNDKTTKTQVRSNFQHARYLMRVADDAMRNTDTDWANMIEVANELVAAAATFSQFVEEQGQQRQRELSDEMRERKNTPGVDESTLLEEYLRRYGDIEADTVAQRQEQNAIDHAEVMRLAAVYKAEQAAYRRKATA